jgi:hypothetical protein
MPVYRIFNPFYLFSYLKIVKRLTDLSLLLPNFYEVIWIWTLSVSIGCIKEVAITPEIPPITKGAKLSEILYWKGIEGVWGIAGFFNNIFSNSG